MAKDKNNKMYWVIGIILLLIIGFSQGWFKNPIANQEGNYFCCSSGNSYSCSLNDCSFGSSKVYTDSFNTLSGCNTQCITPQVIQPPAQAQIQTKTCQQIAGELGALYKNTPVSTAKECLDFAILDCQDTGKVIDGYGISGTCCYYTCVVPAVQPVCTDSDGGQDDQYFVKGTVTSSLTVSPFTDECDWGSGQLKEYYCKEDKTIGVTYHICTDYWLCSEGKCAQQLCEDIMGPTVEKCAAGYTTDGGTCAYWGTNGGECLSSF